MTPKELSALLAVAAEHGTLRTFKAGGVCITYAEPEPDTESLVAAAQRAMATPEPEQAPDPAEQHWEAAMRALEEAAT